MNDQKKKNESYQYQYVTEDRSCTYDMQNQDSSDMASDNVYYPSEKKEEENECARLGSWISR